MTYHAAAVAADKAVMQAIARQLPHALILILMERAEAALNDYRRYGDKEKTA